MFEFMRTVKLAALVVVIFYQCDLQAAGSGDPVPTGVWGGTGIQMTVNADNARIDYGCDFGTIDQRLSVDNAGNFHAKGTHSFGRGGPRQSGETGPKPREARFVGNLKGNTLQVTVELVDLDRKLGPFTLKLGANPILDRCG